MSCPYITGLEENNVDLADAENLSSRAAAPLAGVGKTTVNNHRAGTCGCGQDTTPDVVDTPEPTGRRDSVELGPDGGSLVYHTTDAAPIRDWSDVLQRLGVDPDVFEVDGGSVRISRWQQSARSKDGDRDKITLTAYKALIRKKQETVDLPALYAAARLATPKPQTPPQRRGTVVVYADPQVGKTGRRGGTRELIERSMVIRHKLTELLAQRNPSEITLADAGDGIEGFNSGGNPMFTNDLSLANQLDTYGTELFEFINVCHAHAPVTVMGVPSNHAAWRNGKQNLGIPADDLGLFMHRQVQKVTEASGMAVDWVRPEAYDESVAHTILDTTLGLVHGNQFAPNQAISWWEKQTFGAGAITRADVMVHGHYHTFTAGVAGRNPVNGRQRYCFGAPTLDNGSDWFRQTAGRDSDPGLLVFDITEHGFDLGSLTIL